MQKVQTMYVGLIITLLEKISNEICNKQDFQHQINYDEINSNVAPRYTEQNN